MHYQFPLQALARGRHCESQFEFAKQARSVVKESDEFLLEPMLDGLAIFAANEDALAPPVRLLGEIYGRQIELGAPSVRLIVGEPMQQPVMAVRVRAKRQHTSAVLGALWQRGVKLLEECVRGREFIVRGSAPLQDVMGLPDELAAATDGTAAHWIRLAHYAPMANAAEEPAATL
ncbi:MAG TPA: hypothetical protein VM122_04530 [Usitatibacter sp.]|nr:hypothetical protein [Usitatibacter sp.]